MESLTSISLSDIEQMDRVPRLKLINTLSGFKSANLVGTISPDEHENLAIFSSVIHLGSDPPLMGCITRPRTVPRHTYENIQNNGWYTVNHIHKGIYQQAHQTSGNYREDISEFDVSGLTPWYSDTCKAPYVEEARVRIGLQWVEEHHIEANGTALLVGAIQEIWLPGECQKEDGFLDIEKAETVTISGLESYHCTQHLENLGYVRVEKSMQRKDDEGDGADQ